METALVYQVRKLSWQWFCSFTFYDERRPWWTPTTAMQVASFFSWGRDVARWHRVHFTKQMRWVLRAAEHGELNGREHLHALIGGLPVGAQTIGSRMAAKNHWERFTHSGSARVRRFDSNLEDGEYLFKPEAWSGANAYETAKFGTADCQVLVSSSTWMAAAVRSGGSCPAVGREGAKTKHDRPVIVSSRNPLAHPYDTTPLTRRRS